MFTEEFSETLRTLRKDKGQKQQDLAENCQSLGLSITPSMISHLETGRRRPSSADVVRILAKALNLSESESARLFRSAGLPFPKQMSVGSVPEELNGVLAYLGDPKFVAPFFEPFVFPDPKTINLSLTQLLQAWHEHAEVRVDLRKREWIHVLEKAETIDELARAIHARLTAYIEDVRGIAYYHQGQLARAERHFRQSKYYAEQSLDERAIATGAVHLAGIYKNTARLDEAWQEYSEAKEKFEKLGDRRQVAWVNRKLGTWYLFQGNGKKAMELLEESLRLFQSEGERYEASHTHPSLGWAYSLQGRWDDAVEQYRTALALTMELNHEMRNEKGWEDTYHLFRCHLYLGDSLRQIGQLAEAKEHLELAKKLIDKKVDEQYERGRVYLCLAKLYHQMGEKQWAEAVRLAEKSRDFHIERGQQMKLAQSLCHLGRIYMDLGQNDEAQRCFEDTISLCQEEGVRNYYYEATALVNLCELYCRTGKLEMAEDLAREAEKCCKECEAYQHLARLNVVQAEVAANQQPATDQRRYDRAIGYCKEAYQNAYTFNQYLADEIHKKICDLAAKNMQLQGIAFGQQLYGGLEQVTAGGGWYLTLDRDSQEKFRAQISDLQRMVIV